MFINQPGIRLRDFIDYQKEFLNLQRYLFASSTALKFERVKPLPEETFDELIDQVRESCNIEEVITITGNDTSTFEPYIDVGKRAIRIDYPQLPENNNDRSAAISDYDRFLRQILAQIPSPELTIIYTSLGPYEFIESEEGYLGSMNIYPEIFLDPSRSQEVERNDHSLDDPSVLNEHHPKFIGMSSEYVSIFDQEFIAENIGLLRMIITIFIAFIIFVPLVRPKKVSRVFHRT